MRGDIKNLHQMRGDINNLHQMRGDINNLHQMRGISDCICTELKINRRTTQVGTFKFSVFMHVALRMFIMQVLATQLHFLANRNAELAVPPLFWPVNCIKIGGMLGSRAVYIPNSGLK